MSNESGSCNGCIYSTTKRRFLGWRAYCNKFHCLRDMRCIDFKATGEQAKPDQKTPFYKETQCNRW